MDEKRQSRLSLVWLITAVGAIIYATIQIFSYLNASAGSHGATPALNFTAAQVWVISAFYGAWVIPALLALIDRPTANWVSLIFGGVLVALTTLSGVFDGIRDGGHLVFLALLAITLPGSFAIAMSWRHLRNCDVGAAPSGRMISINPR
ncbi:hypothetical protein [Pseudolabrys sp. FHR47]|uniref:hypothetical protein n=1 Tax=Pseudolabrys sp. FHR47 TaxID=2562284 RepID=UPI0010BE8182|nr:hypothetical protein [Pseudolabrys sp. FHR47]